MAVRYISYEPVPLRGQALLDNFARTRRVLSYRDNNRVFTDIERGMPLYEMEEREVVGKREDGKDNIVIQGECVAACAWLKDQGRTVDLVYIDPPFDSGADYAKKVYLRRNPKVAETVRQSEQDLDNEALKSFEEKMYGDIWNKEDYLNWMYENLMAIKSVMSDNASIYVHLDYHIGHYVKILMDEVFGESNFRNEIIWYYTNKMSGSTSPHDFVCEHDTIFRYSKGNSYCYNTITVAREKPVKQSKRVKIDGKNMRERDDDGNIIYEESKEKKVKDVWQIPYIASTDPQRLDYSTQKPEALLERVIKASSDEGMTVADFFGGSGVTARVANRLGRNFIHCDVSVNSIQKTRDSLVKEDAAFRILDVKDGIRLFRNPVQTMDNLPKLIPGLRRDDSLDKFWAGCFVSPKLGTVPVFVPNILDSAGRILDKAMMATILSDKMPDLPSTVKKVVVYYLECIDLEELQKMIHDYNTTLADVELRDLKRVLDNVVMEDDAAWRVEQVQDGLLTVWRLTMDSFLSDRVLTVIREFNLKRQQQPQRGDKPFTPITVSDEGLETMEWLSVDTTTADPGAPWHSSTEVFINPQGYAFVNGKPTGKLWQGYIDSDDKPLRLKTRNICGDETVYCL